MTPYYLRTGENWGSVRRYLRSARARARSSRSREGRARPTPCRATRTGRRTMRNAFLSVVRRIPALPRRLATELVGLRNR